MKHLKKSPALPVGRFTLLMLLMSMIGSRTFAQDQDLFRVNAMFTWERERAEKTKEERAKEVMQDNEYLTTGHEEGIFFSNPLMLNGKPLDYGEFNLLAKGELTVSKGAVATGQATQVPFYVSLRINGNKVLIPGKERPDPKQIKVDISEILQYAEPGDYLVIEAVRKEDGPVKRILKLVGGGC